MNGPELITGVLQDLIANRIEYIIVAASSVSATYWRMAHLKKALWSWPAAFMGGIVLSASLLVFYGYATGGIRAQLEYFDGRVKLEQRSPIDEQCKSGNAIYGGWLTGEGFLSSDNTCLRNGTIKKIVLPSPQTPYLETLRRSLGQKKASMISQI